MRRMLLAILAVVSVPASAAQFISVDTQCAAPAGITAVGTLADLTFYQEDPNPTIPGPNDPGRDGCSIGCWRWYPEGPCNCWT